ncbi:MAG TPA: HD domain-containing protein [Polyangiaceae bacterium]|jgi:tRNA nucleotidyltransferase (CCA-adding enzyme)
MDVPEEVRAICKQLKARGHEAYVVGGCVRDLLLGKEASDWDVTTDARPAEVQKIFPRVIPTGIQHGTVTVLMGKKQFEVTTFRGEGAYTDGRRPDTVEFVRDITADLARRDFTVNAIALDPDDERIIDPYEGQKDIARKVIRAVGVPLERFREDGLRVLRAARFTATLEFDLDPETERAIGPSLDVYQKVSQERVRDEWVKSMKARRPSRAFDVMRATGILGVTCPEMLEGVGMEQNKWHAYDVWRHGMECLDGCPGDPILRIAAMLHDVGKPRSRAFSDKTKDWTFYDHEHIGAEIAEPICARLRFSNDERARIVHLVRNHLFHYTSEWNDATVRRFIRRVGKERLEDLFALNEADVRAKGRDATPDLSALASLKEHVARVLAAGDALSTKDLAINGRDLMSELAIAPGPILGKILSALLEEVIADPAKNTRDSLLEIARKMKP